LLGKNGNLLLIWPVQKLPCRLLYPQTRPANFIAGTIRCFSHENVSSDTRD